MKNPSINDTVLEFIEDPTPVDNSSLELLELEEVTPIAVAWHDYLVEYLTARLTDSGFKSNLTFDFRAEPTLTVWQDDDSLAHVRVIWGNEDDGNKYCLYFLSVGTASLKLKIDDFSPTGMDQIYYDILAYHRIISTVKNFSPK